jgi:monovalent cation:H+ antiporter-2, CPA2 family
MSGLTALLVAAAIAYGMARALRLPVIPLLVVAGFALAAIGLAPQDELLPTVVEVGLVFLVFAAGVELAPSRVARRGRAALVVGAAQFAVLGAGGWLVARLLGFENLTALFIALALAASSTLVVIGVLKQRQQMFEPYGRLVTGVLLLQDAAVIGLLVALDAWPRGSEAVITGVGGTMALAGMAVILQQKVIPRLAARPIDEEGLLLAALALLAIAVGFGAWFGLPLVAGAFFAGFALSGFPVSGLVRGFLSSLSDFFFALFFVALGALLVIPTLDLLLAGFALGVFLVVATVLVVALTAERAGLSTRSAVESGLLLSQTSEFSLVIALHAWITGLLDAEVFSMLALLTVATMALTPALSADRVTRAIVRMDPRRRWRRPPQLAASGHVLFVGLGTAGERVLRPLLERGRQVLVIDEDAGVIRSLQSRGIPALQGDGSSIETLKRCHARHAAAVVCSLPRTEQAERVARHLQGSPARVIVRVFDPADGSRFSELGAVSVVTATAAAERFMAWAGENGLFEPTGAGKL